MAILRVDDRVVNESLRDADTMPVSRKANVREATLDERRVQIRPASDNVAECLIEDRVADDRFEGR